MRYYLIDDLRALAIINMVIYHALFDLIYIFGFSYPWFEGTVGFVWEQYICWSFILIAGFCQYFGQHSLKEGLIVSFWGIVITIITVSLHLGISIYFGVLTFIGLAILVTIPIKSFLKELNPTFGIVLSTFLFFVFRNINFHSFGFLKLSFGRIPEIFYNLKPSWLFTLIGFPDPGFQSLDYFSFIPWYFLFLLGFFIYSFCKEKDLLNFFTIGKIPILYEISRRSLLIYLLHQPITLALFFLFLH